MAYDERVARLVEIHEEMSCLIDEAARLVRNTSQEPRARSY